MSTFFHLLAFELRFYGSRISTWAYAGVFFALGLLIMLAAGGFFPGAAVGIGGGGGNVHVDSPYVTIGLVGTLSLFAIMVTAALSGNAGYRDHGDGIAPLIFTTPVGKAQYLGSRYLATLLLNLFVYLGIAAGLVLGANFPGQDAERFGGYSLAGLVAPYAVIVVPNLIWLCALFLALPAVTRRMFPNYVLGVGLLVAYMIAGQFSQDLDNRWLVALLDPFGMEAYGEVTRYFTTAERNGRVVWFEGELLTNRALWTTVGLATFGLLSWRFRFAQAGADGKSARHVVEERGVPAALHPPAVPRDFGGAAARLQLARLTRRAIGDVFGSVYFWAIVFAALAFMLVVAPESGRMFGTPTWPVTYMVLDVLGGTFALFLLIVVTVYAGELAWHERDLKVDALVDTSPVGTYLPYLARLIALLLLVAVLLVVVAGAGVLTQLSYGYTNLELGKYAVVLWGLYWPDYALTVVLALAVHAIVNHKYAGHVVMILYYVFTAFRGQLGLEHDLYAFGSDPGIATSDMNDLGPFLGPWILYKLYWAAWAIVLAVASTVLWNRGAEGGLKARLARARVGRGPAVVGGIGLVAALVLGGFIFWNTNVQNTYRTSWEAEERAAVLEKQWRPWYGRPQPKITAVDAEVDLYPDQGDVITRGKLVLLNKTDAPIPEILIRTPIDIEVRALALDLPGQLDTSTQKESGYAIFRAAQPLSPGASATVTFELAGLTPGFTNGGPDTSVVANGTFVNNQGLVPSVGYTDWSELEDDRTRRKHGLEPKERARPLEDQSAWNVHQLGADADFVDFAVTVSTSADQRALAPGYLVREWEDGGRRFFRYEMDAPILNFWSVLSGRYEIRKDAWNDVAIEVWYDPAHAYNIDRMIDGTKKSLAYCSEAFAPYQHRQVRIVEFPRYATFAQSFPNTIPFSEAIGFVARLEDEDAIDYPFYVTAHEVAHQWWAHQVIGANVQGATVLTETLAQYTALRVMELEYGPEHLGRFLDYELDDYLTGRAFETKKELPLMRVENQQYIHYNKGSIAMMALREAMGQEAMDRALKRFTEEWRFRGPPYPTTLDLMAYLRAELPPDKAYVLTDLFETITLYENKVLSATARPAGDGYEVVVSVEVKKLRSDDQGNETELPVRERFELGLYADGEELPFQVDGQTLEAGPAEVRLRTTRLPDRVGIDPRRLMIDRHTSDDSVAVTVEGT